MSIFIYYAICHAEGLAKAFYPLGLDGGFSPTTGASGTSISIIVEPT